MTLAAQMSGLDLSYTPPLGSPWDAEQMATQSWKGPRCAERPPPASRNSCGRANRRLAAHYDMRAQHQAVPAAARSGPLQSLTQRELGLREQPLTIYPCPLAAVSAWVRFGPEAIRVDAKLVRSTPFAAGIEFRAGDQTFWCWVWSNAVQLRDE